MRRYDHTAFTLDGLNDHACRILCDRRPYGIWVVIRDKFCGASGSKGFLYFSLWVTLRAPSVRPWKACSVEMNSFLPDAFRASFRAPSTASALSLIHISEPTRLGM